MRRIHCLVSGWVVIDLGLGHVRLSPDEIDEPTVLGREYAPLPGLPALREAIAVREGVPAEHVAVTTGAAAGLAAVLGQAPRGRLLCPRPHFPAYPKVAEMFGFDVAYYELEERLGWLPDPDRLARAVSSDVTVVLWNFPSNPTGSIASAEHVEALGRAVRDGGALVVSDEVYDDLMFDGEPVRIDGVVEPNNLVRIRSFSKAFRIPGQRVGYVIADPTQIVSIARAHWELVMSAPITSQALALAILRRDPDHAIVMLRKVLQQHRDVAVETLRASDRVRVSSPPAGLFCWVELPDTRIDATEFANRCREEKQLIVVPGTVFGVHDRPFLRVSFAVPLPELEEGLAALLEMAER